MSDSKIYADAAKAFRYMAEKKEREAEKLQEKAKRCLEVAIDQRRLAEEMDEREKQAIDATVTPELTGVEPQEEGAKE